MYCNCALIENDNAVILSQGTDINIDLRSKELELDEIIVINATESITAENRPTICLNKAYGAC